MLVVKINHLTIVYLKARSPFVLNHTTSSTAGVHLHASYCGSLLQLGFRGFGNVAGASPKGKDEVKMLFRRSSMVKASNLFFERGSPNG